MYLSDYIHAHDLLLIWPFSQVGSYVLLLNKQKGNLRGGDDIRGHCFYSKSDDRSGTQMWHIIWDVPVFAGIQNKIAEIQDKIKDSPTQTKTPICSEF